jgi:hypothetical protein
VGRFAAVRTVEGRFRTAKCIQYTVYSIQIQDTGYRIQKRVLPEDGVYDGEEDRYFMPFEGYLTHQTDEE